MTANMFVRKRGWAARGWPATSCRPNEAGEPSPGSRFGRSVVELAGSVKLRRPCYQRVGEGVGVLMGSVGRGACGSASGEATAKARAMAWA